jgi:hypothetical protein
VNRSFFCCLARSRTRSSPGDTRARLGVRWVWVLPVFPLAPCLRSTDSTTLRRHPHGCLRTARGRCDSLRLHRNGLSPSTLCRSVPAHNIANAFCGSIPTGTRSRNRARSGGSGGGALTYTVGGTIFGLAGDGSSSLSGARHSRQYRVTDQRHASFSSPSFRKLIAGSSVDSTYKAHPINASL